MIDDECILALGDQFRRLFLFKIDFQRWEMDFLDSTEVLPERSEVHDLSGFGMLWELSSKYYQFILDQADQRKFIVYHSSGRFVTGHVTKDNRIVVDIEKRMPNFRKLKCVQLDDCKLIGLTEGQRQDELMYHEFDLNELIEEVVTIPCETKVGHQFNQYFVNF